MRLKLLLVVLVSMLSLTGLGYTLQLPPGGTTVYLPLVTRPPGMIYGQVTENEAPVADLVVKLIYCRVPSSTPLYYCEESQVFETTTDGGGRYSFIDMPTLVISGTNQMSQTYEVVWSNSDDDPGRLPWWRTRTLNTYRAGDLVNIGNFDIGGVHLLTPTNGAHVTIPIIFQWTLRSPALDDRYGPCIWYGPGVPFSPTPPPVEVIQCYEILGYVDNFTLTNIPVFEYPHYRWKVYIYSRDGGIGVTAEYEFTYEESQR